MEQDVIKRGKEQTTKQYAYMNLPGSLCCPFLNREKLCDIHGQLGENYLCGTCVTYPRTLNKINEDLELSLLVSCPEAAKLILLNREPMKFVEREINVHPKLSTMHFSDHQEREIAHFWGIRTATMKILQCRNYSLEDRFIIIGLMYQKIDNLIRSEQAELIPSVIADYVSNAREGIFHQSLGEARGQTEMKLQLFHDIFSGKLSSMTRSPIYDVLSIKSVDGLRKKGEGTFDLVNNYCTLYREKFLPLMEEKGYILENYFVNHTFSRLVPFHYYGAFGSFIHMVCLYVLLKSQLIGLIGNDEVMSDELIIDLLFSFHRTFDADVEFHNFLAKYIERNNLKDFGNLVLFIRE